MSTDFLHSLNPVQREAVLHQEGPLLLLAGAGSGKTRVLTHRIGHLIEQCRVSPFHILAITFTNKAAAEMRERLGRLIGPRAHDVWVSTFHSTCMRILRKDGEKLGYDRSFVIYDYDDQQRLLKECLKELNIDEKRFKPQAVGAAISSAKNRLVGPVAFERQAYDHFAQISAKVYHIYQKKLKAHNAMDFDDLLVNGVCLFREFPHVLDNYQDRFRYIHVDEYQDTNHAQYVLVKLLADKYRNLCVVGDDDQSIYGWRGADIQNILDFERDYPEAVVLKLEQNYRSTGKILEAANAVVGNNRGRKSKKLWTQNPSGQPIVAYQGETEHDEARYIVRTIKRLSESENRPYRDFAILYRTNAQSRVLEEHFMYAGIPYRIFGGLRFYERKEIKDIVAYLRFISNPADAVSFRRVVNVPKRGIGDATVQKLLEHADSEGWTVGEALARVGEVPGLSRAVKALSAFGQMIEELRREAPSLLVTQIVEAILNRTGYVRELEAEKTEEAKGRIENIKEFLSVTKEFDRTADDKTLEEFLAGVSLVSDTDNYNEDEDAVVLMTMHSAKGLEFPVVFVAGMEEGVFPHSRVQFEETQVEEERRLCYVAITRARERLYLARAWRRTLFGNTVSNKPSRFLEEIPASLLVEEDDRAKRDSLFSDATLSSSAAAAASANKAVGASGFGDAVEFTVGDKVQHGKFGLGIVVKASGSGENQELSVAFPQQGIKKLLLKYAGLKRV
ncbi:ATP-dependent DNA helicase pcra [Heliomicrobium modesticaldum Ice1]|uniref:ATP-dependent DNA helicase n=1 Tax=Heliobacterium modesticaldum (strain ATCC 51547 / Ice1) TaxID=498761 RepID=B0TDL1_HELMI|nr:DNA helicase PcrA [Heliomicrobium modesticaldum]ABZ85536.1 ATP-dependent DNA helicase pcra [Heliomicrobium modesticaldum Ice1]